MVLSLSTVNRVEELVARAQATGRAPTIVAGVVRDGTLAHVAAAGEQPLADRGTQFRIGSISKSLTAATLLGLRDEGRLSLDDRIATFLPELAEPVGALRLRQLISHAAGLQREPDGAWWERHDGVTPAELYAGVDRAKIAFPPYLRFHYSNLAYGLLGGVVEQVTGMTWFDAVRRRLLEPLGMGRTTYAPQEPYARGYVVHPWAGTLHEEPREDARAMAAAGQVWSTVEDLARWAAVLAQAPPGGALNAGSVLAPATVAEMTTPVVLRDPDHWTAGYGLGLQLRRHGERVFCGHTGSMPGYLAVLWVHRPTRTGVVAFANIYNLHAGTISDLGMSIVEAVLDSEPATAPSPWRSSAPAPAGTAPLCGRWWWMGYEIEVSWDQAAQQLRIGDPGNIEDVSCLRPDGTDRWLCVSGDDIGEVLTVHRDEDGSVTALEIATTVLHREPDADV